MGIHIISVLGTSLYEPVYYQGKKEEAVETEFIQAAVINEYREQIKKGGKVTIFVTDLSEQKNWKDRTYTANEVGFAEKWVSARKENVVEGADKKGLQSVIKGLFPEIEEHIECIKIPDMKTEEEIWEVFENIYECIEENDELVFDITHSFRSIPMLAVTVINYAKVLKHCKLEAVYYGAFEAAKGDGERKIAPIIDLTVFNEILEWTYAADSFVNYGNVDKMKEAYKIRNDRIPNEEKCHWSPIRTLIQNMENVALGIATCRGIDSDKLDSKKNMEKKSVRQAYLKLRKSIDAQKSGLGNDITPMIKLIEYATKEFQMFDTCQYDYEVGIEIIRWSIRYRMVQQGYTALEETIKTFICELYGINAILLENREFIVSSMLTACPKEVPDDRVQLFRHITQKDKRFAPTYDKLDDQMKEKVGYMIMEIPKTLFQLVQSVKGFRNDINHMGFNNATKTSDSLEKNLKEYFDKFVQIVEQMKNMDIMKHSAPKAPKGFTHAGVFHADDVFATALLKIVYPGIVIERGVKVPDDYDGIVYDIGFGKYDHHQANRKVRENGVPYAAFGLLWEEYGPELVGEQMAEYFDEEFVQKLDLSDNTGEPEVVCDMISGFNGLWNEDSDEDTQFDKAVNVAKVMLERQIQNLKSKEKAIKEVRRKVSQAKNQVLILEKAMPWKEALADTDILYVVMESNRGGYIIQAVPKAANTIELKKAFPKEWCGAVREDLFEMTGIETLTFCHVSGFLCATETKEDAIRVAECAVNA